MDFTQLTDDQKNELRFKHLKAQLLQDTGVSSIIPQNDANKTLSKFLDEYQVIVDNFRGSVMRATNEENVKHSLEHFLNRVDDFLEPDINTEYKTILNNFKNRKKSETSIVHSDVQALSCIQQIAENVGLCNSVASGDFFNRFDKKAEDKIKSTNESFEKKLQTQIANQLFGDTDKNPYKAQDLSYLVANSLEDIEKSTQPIQRHKNFSKFNLACQDFMHDFGFKQFIFDVTSIEDIVEFNKNLIVLKTAMIDSADTLGIKKEHMGMEDCVFSYFNKGESTLGSYSHESGKFSVNSRSLSDLQKKILSDDADSAAALDRVSSTITHEWMHLLDTKLVKKIQEAQIQQGLQPQFRTGSEDAVSYQKSSYALSELDGHVYGLHKEEHRNLREAVAEFREIQKDFLNEDSASINNDVGARREFMEVFWSEATNVKSPESRTELFTEKAFDTVFAYMHNPHNNENERAFNSFMKKAGAKLHNESFFFQEDGVELKNPLSPELLDTHTKLVASLNKIAPVLDENNKSEIYKNGEVLDGIYNKTYYSQKLEVFARYVQSNFYPIKEDSLAYGRYSEDHTERLSERISSIIGKTFGASVLNEENMDLFLQENPSYKEKPEPNNFMLASRKFINGIKSTFGIDSDESYQLPLREKDKFDFKIMRLGKIESTELENGSSAQMKMN